MMLLHLVNYNVTLDGDITPVHNPTVRMLLPEGKSLNALSYNGRLAAVESIEYTTEMRGANQIVTFKACFNRLT